MDFLEHFINIHFKYMLPNLSALNKTFQTRCLNFSRAIPSINRHKTKIQEIEKNGKVLG